MRRPAGGLTRGFTPRRQVSKLRAFSLHVPKEFPVSRSSRHSPLLYSVLLAGIALPGSALATNGYFTHGFGVRAQAVAGDMQ